MCNSIGFLILALSVSPALSVAVVERHADHMCTRADGKPGYCVPTSSCPKIRSILARQVEGLAYSADDAVYSRNSRCPEHKQGFVCCEDDDTISTTLSDLRAYHRCGEFGIAKVVGGIEIGLMSRPWMALLYMRDQFDEERFKCGGSVINKRFILTAAHCFNLNTLLYVRLGEHNIVQESDCTQHRGRRKCAPPVEDFDADRIYIHEQYGSGAGHHDIALIKLARDIEYKESIRPICLPADETLQARANVIAEFHVTGWGKTETTSFSDVPLETIVQVNNNGVCHKYYQRRQIVSTQLCAGTDGKDSCNGDSGGPLSYIEFLNNRQRFVEYGVVSFGSSSCGDGTPGVYTKVGSYIRWIAYKIATK